MTEASSRQVQEYSRDLELLQREVAEMPEDEASELQSYIDSELKPAIEDLDSDRSFLEVLEDEIKDRKENNEVLCECDRRNGCPIHRGDIVSVLRPPPTDLHTDETAVDRAHEFKNDHSGGNPVAVEEAINRYEGDESRVTSAFVEARAMKGKIVGERRREE